KILDPPPMRIRQFPSKHDQLPQVAPRRLPDAKASRRAPRLPGKPICSHQIGSYLSGTALGLGLIWGVAFFFAGTGLASAANAVAAKLSERDRADIARVESYNERATPFCWRKITVSQKGLTKCLTDL
ncbi:MAG: hypothetical protein VB959_13950, partial [Rhodospirillales bacterium]